MLVLRPAAERGQFDHGWLLAKHSFSFGAYVDRAHMGFGVLRVINEDRIAPGQGFGMHGHRDMEIITWIIAGALVHRDSLGHGSTLRRGEVQRMSAGRGVQHSEFNPSAQEETHLLQIWIEPAVQSVAASYEQVAVPLAGQAGRWLLIASPDGAEGSTTIHQDARLAVASLPAGQLLSASLAPGRLGYVQLVRGQLRLNGQKLVSGDGVRIHDELSLQFTAVDDCEVLFFDLPPHP
ncbi:MAG: pirin family protein [Dechloromonas sp.]|nr:pirin family protein [Dechloromonas sp.]